MDRGNYGDRDFNGDTKDSGEVGVGHQVTALCGLVMADAPEAVRQRASGSADPLKYQPQKTAAAGSGGLLAFKLRCRQPEGKSPSRLMEFDLASVPEKTGNWERASAVAEFALLLRDSPHRGSADFDSLLKRARKSPGSDEDSRRAEFLTMAAAAKELSKK